VLLVTARKLLDGRLNVGHASFRPHLTGAEVAVEASTIPIWA
jgi:hypothetical protein